MRANNIDFSTIKVTLKKTKWKQRGFFDQRNYIEKSTWKKRGFFDQRNYMEKVHENDVEIRRNLVLNISRQCRQIMEVGFTCCAHLIILFIKLSTESVYLISSNT